MKNIFLFIDFSKHAYNAALYAAELAQHTGARLILFHSYCPFRQTQDEELQNLEIKAQVKLDELACELKSLYPISVTRLLKPGNVVEEIFHVAVKIKADLLVLGVAETTLQFAPVLDEFTTKLLSQATLPVMLTPPNAIFRSFEKAYVNLKETNAIHSIPDLSFLNKFFYKFREVHLISPKQLKQVHAVPVPENYGMSSFTSVIQPQVKSASGNNLKELPVLNLQVQVIIRAYTSPAEALCEINDRSVSLTEAVPVLLLPNRIF